MFRHYRNGGREALLSQNIILPVARYMGKNTKQPFIAFAYMYQKYDAFDCAVGRRTTVPFECYNIG